MRPQVHGRTVSLLLGFQTFHPLAFTPAWGEAGLGLLPWQEQVARITADPDLAARIVADAGSRCGGDPMISFMRPEPHLRARRPARLRARARSAARAAIAAARGVDEWEMLLELLLGDGGRELLNAPVLNYTDGNLDAVGEMLHHPDLRLRARRRRRPRRPDVRRVHHHLPAHPLVTRPRPRAAHASRRPCTR